VITQQPESKSLITSVAGSGIALQGPNTKQQLGRSSNLIYTFFLKTEFINV
jgi:hypothetical protein